MTTIKCALKDCMHNNFNQGGLSCCRCDVIGIEKIDLNISGYYPVCDSYLKTPEILKKQVKVAED